MADKQSFHPLVEHREELANTLDPHIDSLVQKFSDMKLLSDKDTSTLEDKPKQDKLRVNFFLDIVHDKMENNDIKSYDELIKFMKSAEEYTSLLSLANKMTNPEEVPLGQPVESESSTHIVQDLKPPQYSHQVSQEMVTSSTPCISPLQCNSKMSTATPTVSIASVPVDPTDEASILKSIAEKQNNIIKVRYSTVLCTGETKAGKTKFCNLLMNKTTQSPAGGDYHSVFVKKHGENDWREINFEQLIDQINDKCCVSHAKHTGTDEVLDILILLDINVPAPAICLLQPAIVTFVTYRLRGQEDVVCTRTHKFIKELMSSNCFGRKPRFEEFEATDTTEKASYTAFIGTIYNDENNSKEVFKKEVAMVSESLTSLKGRINCSLREFPLELWYEESSDGYLHVVDLKNTKDENVSKIKDLLDKTVTQNSIHKIPASWALLGLSVQRICYEQKVQFVLYKVVFEKIWKTECNMHDETELERALQFFHHQGVLFHFSTVKGASDYVFTRCCWMFDKLKYLLGGLKDEKIKNREAKQLLLRNGILNSKMIREVEFEGPGKMTFKGFINLLQHLKFIAPVSQNEYFIPSILQSHESDKRAFEIYGNARYDSLLITFSSGSLHRSVFCFLSAHLLSKTPDGWSPLYYDEKVKQQRTFKDLITFSIGIKEYVCIMDKTFFLQIQIRAKSEQCNPKLHSSVLGEIEEALKVVCKNLDIPTERCKYGFLCSNDECQSDEHMMILKDLNELQAHCSKTNQPLQLLNKHILWLEGYQQIPVNTSLHGQATTDSEDVNPDGTTSYDKEDSSLRVHSEAVPYAGSTRRLSDPGGIMMLGKNTDRPSLKLLHRFKKEISKIWFDLGVELIDNSESELNNLQENFPKDADKCCSKMFQLWLKRCGGATWNQLVQALRVPGIEMFELANKIESMLLTEPVQAKTVPADMYYMDNQRHRNSTVVNPGFSMELETNYPSAPADHSHQSRRKRFSSTVHGVHYNTQPADDRTDVLVLAEQRTKPAALTQKKN